MAGQKDWRTQLKTLEQRVNERSLRERALLLVVVLVFLVMGWDIALNKPMQAKTKHWLDEVQNIKNALGEAELKMEQLVNEHSDIQIQALKSEHAALQEEVSQLIANIQQRSMGIVSPQAMTAVIRRVLQEQEALKLIKISSIEVSDAMGIESDDEQLLRQHPFVIEFEGGYFETLSYLKRLESWTAHFFWDEINYKVGEYPKARVSLKVHTLSDQEGWVGG